MERAESVGIGSYGGTKQGKDADCMAQRRDMGTPSHQAFLSRSCSHHPYTQQTELIVYPTIPIYTANEKDYNPIYDRDVQSTSSTQHRRAPLIPVIYYLVLRGKVSVRKPTYVTLITWCHHLP